MQKRVSTALASSLKVTRRNFSTSISSAAPNTEKWAKQLNASLKDTDPEMFDIIEHEKNRQYKGLQLIPSEVSFIGNCKTVEHSDLILFTLIVIASSSGLILNLI